MMKNYLLTAGLFAWAALCASCSNADLPGRDYSVPAGNTIAFQCQAAWGGEHRMVWTADSRIGLFCEQTGTKNLEMGATALTVGEIQGLFYSKLKWAAGEHTLYLYSPYNKANTTMNVAGILPDIQTQRGAATDHIQAASLMFAKVLSAEVAEPMPVTMVPVLGYLDFVATSTAKYKGYSVKSITLSNKSDIALAGAYTFDLGKGQVVFETPTPQVVLKVTGGSELAEPFHGYAVVNPAAVKGVKCDVQVILEQEEKDDVTLVGETTFAENIAPEVITPVALALDDMKVEGGEDTSINLSENATANCYVAGIAGQTYRFKATVMGNGYTTPATDSYAGAGLATGITPVALNPQSAQLLWQTEKSLISDVKLKNGYIYFTLNGSQTSPLVEGNAVIAAYSEKGGVGNILWSWHIWVTATDLASTLQTYVLPGAYADAGQTIMMDRNLGASKTGMWGSNNDNQALGLLYQWGRKDPFPNIDDSTIGGTGALAITLLRKTYDANDNEIAVSNTATAATDFKADSWLYFNGKVIPRAEIARYPMNFGYLNTTTNWLDEAADDLWGNAFSEEVSQIGHKSIYDPCPPGYRVPHRYFGTISTTDGENATNKDAPNLARWKGQYTTQADIQANGGNIYSFGGGDASWPLGGMLFISGNIVPFRTGKYVGHWQVSMPANNVKNSYRFYIDYGNTKPHDNNARYVGGSVRCMKE